MSIADRFARAPAWARMLAACLAVEVALLAGAPSLLEINRQAWDVLFKLRNRSTTFRPVYQGSLIYVDVDDSTLRTLGARQLSRHAHADLMRLLAEYGVVAQFHDMVFAWPSEPAEDNALVEATRDTPGVFHGFALDLTSDTPFTSLTEQTPPTPPELLLHRSNVRVTSRKTNLPQGRKAWVPFDRLGVAASGLGFINILPDRDGVVRRAPLFGTYNGSIYASAAMLLVAKLLDVPSENIAIEAGPSVKLIGARMPGETARRDIRIPIDARGNVLINFIGPWETMDHYGASDILSSRENSFDRQMMAQELHGKVAIVAYTSTGSADVGPVPADPAFVLAGVHAHLVNTILSGAFLSELGPLGRVILIDAPIIALFSFLAMHLPPIGVAFATVVIAVVYLAAVFAAFVKGWLVPVYDPLFLLVACSAAGVVARYGVEHRQRQALRQALDAYFPPGVVDRLLATPGGFRATSVRKELSILFSDIAGFTSYSGQVDPESVQRLLNEYFDSMVEIVFAHGGTVDKFIGDGLMVFFGDPEPQPDHAVRCVRCAIAMQAKIRELREEWTRRGGMPIRVRIGISTGEAVVGNMGSARRLSYTVIGNVVNLAQRLEASGEPDGILISRRTYELLNGAIRAESAGMMQLKGMHEPVQAYRVVMAATQATANDIPAASAGVKRV